MLILSWYDYAKKTKSIFILFYVAVITCLISPQNNKTTPNYRPRVFHSRSHTHEVIQIIL